MIGRSHEYRRPFHAAVGFLAAFLVLGTAASARAQNVPGADLDSIHAWLIEHNPEIRMRALEAEAAEQRIQPAGALPDPMLSMEMRGIDRNQVQFFPGQVDNTLYQIRQRFPLWGKRELARAVARDKASAARAMRDSTALELLERADTAYVRYWHSDAAVGVVHRVLRVLADLRLLAEARYGAGLAPQQDAIKAQVETTSMRLNLIERTSTGRQAAALLNGVLSRDPDAALTAPTDAPALLLDFSLHELLVDIPLRHPMVLAQSELTSAADSTAEFVRRQRYPDLTVGVGLMQMGNQLESWELMLQVEIPLQQTARRHRERASLLMRDAAQEKQKALVNELRARAGDAWARWQGALDQRKVIEKTLLPQAEANFHSALASYQVGAVDFGTLLDSLRQWLDADIAQIDTRRDELVAAAEVRALKGELQ